MYREKNKATKILEELIDYFLRNELNEMNMRLHLGEDELMVHIDGPCPEKPPDYDELYDFLNEPRRPELEEYYFELLGGNVRHEELKLLGSMVDRAEMSYEKGQLTITVYRKKS